MQQRFFSAKPGISVTDGSSQNSADNIAGSVIGWKLPVSNGKGDGTNMIGDHPERDIGAGITGLVTVAGQLFRAADGACKQVGIVVGIFLLQYPDKPFQSHTGIYVFGRQGLKPAIGQPVELNKYVVPDFNHLGVVLVYQGFSLNPGPFFV